MQKRRNNFILIENDDDALQDNNEKSGRFSAKNFIHASQKC